MIRHFLLNMHKNNNVYMFNLYKYIYIIVAIGANNNFKNMAKGASYCNLITTSSGLLKSLNGIFPLPIPRLIIIVVLLD